MPLKGRTILVVEDDQKVRTLLRRTLESDGAKVHEASDGTVAMDMLRDHDPDLITLDLDLGPTDGLDVARQVRQASAVPIIMITGKGDVIDRVVGLELGADDYIAKPFHVREVLARVKTVLRRGAEPPSQVQGPSRLRLDGLTLDLDRMEVLDRTRRPCDVTTADIRLLRAFVDHPMRTLSRDRLMDLTQGAEWSPLDRAIDNQVARLRKKIERDPAEPQLIRTVRGVGYMLTERPVAMDGYGD
ncbi:DNA-binding response regulator [Jannaschia pagri]|uniref:DNA-binding response regulator n=1 Tax=Jannaschia pagri TaxID=2829797 RepID=A0ABQ4NMC7_9RHOB|nr:MULTISPECIES: response regulator transcription factor [unclassified Jannaschia]GIT91551.1 DNA-binding response regulator [Jannaschia sp. AI_61]GIT95385.1 DNA-binding response regulator [Jannaschia sp. AI_62]